MITPECLKLGEFKDDPFTLVPREAAVIWVNRDAVHPETGKSVDLMNYLIKICKQSIFGVGTGITEFTGIAGDLGSGKSHTLIHLSNRLIEQLPEAIVVYLKTVRVSEKTSFLELYSEVIQSIGKQRFIEISRRLNEIVSTKINNKVAKGSSEDMQAMSKEGLRTDQYFGRDVLRELSEDEDSKRILVLLLKLAENPDLYNWLKGGKSANESSLELYGENVDLPALKSDFIAIRVFSTLVKVLTGIQDENGKPAVSGMVVMIDQWDRMTENDRMYVSLTSGFNDLLRDTPEGLCLLFASMGDVTDLFGVLGETLQSIITSSPLLLDVFDENVAKRFLIELFKEHRIDDPQAPQAHPFTMSAIEKIVELTDKRVPRRLIENAKKVFSEACSSSILKKGKINVDFVEKVIF